MVNEWVKHVKEYARIHNISYACAVSKAKASYQNKEQRQNEAFRQSLIPYYAKKVQKAVRNRAVRTAYQTDKQIKSVLKNNTAQERYSSGRISSNIFFE